MSMLSWRNSDSLMGSLAYIEKRVLRNPEITVDRSGTLVLLYFVETEMDKEFAVTMSEQQIRKLIAALAKLTDSSTGFDLPAQATITGAAPDPRPAPTQPATNANVTSTTPTK